MLTHMCTRSPSLRSAFKHSSCPGLLTSIPASLSSQLSRGPSSTLDRDLVVHAHTLRLDESHAVLIVACVRRWQ